MFITAVGIIGAGIIGVGIIGVGIIGVGTQLITVDLDGITGDGTAAFIMAGIILITVMDTMATGTTIMIDIDGDIPIIIEEPHTEVIT
jgi:hypothetical protein